MACGSFGGGLGAVGGGLGLSWEWFGGGLGVVWKWFGNGLEVAWVCLVAIRSGFWVNLGVVW